jgi:hypothetical protein
VRVYRFTDPRDERYARASRRGAWLAGDGDVCGSCTASRQQRAQPLRIVWEPGSEVVGDFTWPGFDSEAVITDRVLAELRPLGGFEPGPIEMIDDPEIADRGASRVSLPYEGPSLFEVWVTTWVGVDRARSSVSLEHACAACGAEQWEVTGVERWNSKFDRTLQQLVRTKSERQAGSGLTVHPDDLGGAGIFRVREFPAWIFCIEGVREAVQTAGFSNVSFLEMGETA